MRTRAGQDKLQGSVETRFAHPSLAWSDPRASNPVPKNLSWSGNVSGPIKRGALRYNFGVSHNTQSSDFVSLLSLNDLQREQSGLSVDSIAAVRQTLAGLGIPVTAGGIPDASTSRNRSMMLRLDAVPSATTSLIFTGSADDSRQLGAGVSALGFPSLSSRSDSRNLRAQLSMSSYFSGFMDQASASVQRNSSGSGPSLSLPSGRVRLGAEYPGGTVGLTDVMFGGANSGESDNTSTIWSLQHEVSWLTADSRHRFAFGQSIELNRTLSRNVAAPYGTFAYQSLEDLTANRPASYSRTLSSVERSTTSTTSALWLQGESRVKPERLQFEYGLRLDFSHPGTRPGYNPVVDSLFGRRTDQVPGAVGLSPRFGFTWVLASPQANRYVERWPITIHGGVGAFRGVIPSQRIAGLIDATGLPNSIRQLECVGEATPRPDWGNLGSPSAVPAACLDGAAPVEFSTEVPGVQLFNAAYRPETSWRGNVDVSGLGVAGWNLGLGGEYSRIVNGESAIDLNLRRTPTFTLSGEGDRPMYVAPSGIVPVTGAIAPGASRLSDRFGAVTDYLADLQSRAFQFSLRLDRRRPLFGKLPLSLNYSYRSVRKQERGFNGSTAGDPLLRQWAYGDGPAHTFQAQTSFNIPLARLSLQATLVSGTPYTPMVSGDVNGDGRSNDQAFVFDPAATADPVLAQQMGDLLATATPSTRACLEAQFGRIAGRQSCRTGWRLQPDMRFDLRLPGLSNPQANRSALGDRLLLSVTTSNLMGTLLHLAGVGSTSLNMLSGANYPLDRTLLYVNGFDPEAQRFVYRVNQQFGEGRPQRFRNSRSRYTGAFQVQLGARLMLGHFKPRSSMAQQLGLVSRDRKMPAPTEAEVRERLHRLIQDPVSMLLALRDSVLLTDEQVRRMEARQVAFSATADSVLAPVVAYVVESGGKAKDKQVQKLVGKARQTMWPLMRETLREAIGELKEEQKQRLPPMFTWMTEGEGQQGKGKRQSR
jgi:hypothetical protein